MRPYLLLALLPLLFSSSVVYTLPIEEVSNDVSYLTHDDYASEDYGADDFSLGLDEADTTDEDLRGGRRIRQAVKAVKQILRKPAKPAPAPAKPVAKPVSPPPPAVLRRAAPPVLPVSSVIHTIVKAPQTQSAKANKVAEYISILNTDIDKNHRVFMTQYNAELAKLREISKRKLYTEEDYLKAQQQLHAKYKVWKDTLHAFSISNSTLTSLRHHNSSFTEEKNLLTHLYEYVKMFSTKQGYYKHNCVCNATLVGDLRSVQSATTLS
jgi:hypothetical protein